MPPYPVLVHTVTTSSTLHLYEHLTSPESPPKEKKNALIFLPGLGDGPHTIPYVRCLATSLSSLAPSYTVFEARLSSAFSAFGYASLAQDAAEIKALVGYLRKELGTQRVVLLGHSTGCQDCLEYSLKEGGEGVDGVVLQGPVSDREAILMGGGEGVETALEVARGMVENGRGGEVLEREVLPVAWRGSPVTAYRWVSLAGVGGDDDYFSSDLSDGRLAAIWGKLEQRVLILPSEKDEWVPEHVNVTGLVARWKSFCKPGIASGLSGLIPGANHRVDNEDGQEWLADRIARFLAEIGE